MATIMYHPSPPPCLQIRAAKASLLSPEVPADSPEPHTSLLFRLPDGSKLSRRFGLDQRVQELFDYLDSEVSPGGGGGGGRGGGGARGGGRGLSSMDDKVCMRSVHVQPCASPWTAVQLQQRLDCLPQAATLMCMY
jgi:hypothetical protein